MWASTVIRHVSTTSRLMRSSRTAGRSTDERMGPRAWATRRLSSSAMMILVAGGGGAIGGHLVARLLEEGHQVRVADIKPPDEWWQCHEDAENWQLDLAQIEDCRVAV